MIKIPPISKENAEKFYLNVKPIFISFLSDPKNLPKYEKIINYFIDNKTKKFDENKIKKVLIGDKKHLLDAIHAIHEVENSGEIEQLYNAFRKTSFARGWPTMIGIKVCPYCNRAYISYEKEVTYDHYYCKSKYPYLGISMKNLIPCCWACNRDKSTFDTFNNDFVYPFEDEFGYDIIFDVKQNGDIFGKTQLTHKYSIDIISKTNLIIPKAFINEINKLNLLEKYRSHEDDIDRIFKSLERRVFLRAQSIENTFGSTFLKESLIPNYSDITKWHNILLSKFTYDIVEKYYK